MYYSVDLYAPIMVMYSIIKVFNGEFSMSIEAAFKVLWH